MKTSYIVLIIVVVVVLAGIGAYFFTRPTAYDGGTATTTPSVATTTGQQAMPVATTTDNGNVSVIGTSAGGNAISAYHYGTGSDEILFVGGIHGGYEWNTVKVAYDLMDYLDKNPKAIAANEKVTVIPVLNPDGLNKVFGVTDGSIDSARAPALASTVVGRFNANNVDLNRNFDCDWQANGVWQSTKVSGGTAAFSEPESQAVKAYIAAQTPKAVVVWYSSAGGVYSSSCHNGVSAETTAITQAYAKASGYPAHESFDFYATTGDMVNWLAKQGIPAISVLLTNHTDTEWSKNQAGITALLTRYAK